MVWIQLAILIGVAYLIWKWRKFMPTQEERLRAIEARLQAVLAGIETLKQQLADLKVNNPELEDEIEAIEGTVTEMEGGAGPAPTEPSDGGGQTGGGPTPNP